MKSIPSLWWTTTYILFITKPCYAFLGRAKQSRSGSTAFQRVRRRRRNHYYLDLQENYCSSSWAAFSSSSSTPTDGSGSVHASKKTFVPQKVSIVGAGAIGLYYGARLQEIGHECQFYTRTLPEADEGLVVTSTEGDVSISPNEFQVFDDTAQMQPSDWVLVALKSSSLDAIPDLIIPLLQPTTRILCIMNGLIEDDLVQMIRAKTGDDLDQDPRSPLACCQTLYGGMALICCNRLAPGRVDHSYAGLLSAGVAVSKSINPQDDEDAFNALFGNSKVPIAYEQNLLRGRWKKMVWNLPFNGISVAMGGITVDKIVTNSDLRALAYTIMDETVATANTELDAVFGPHVGEPLGEAEKDQMMKLSDGMGAYKTSTMLDLTNRRAMEVRYLFREPVKRAERLGVPVPQLQSTVVIMEALQQKYCDENLMIGRWETLEDVVHQTKFLVLLSQQTPATNDVILEQLIRTLLSSVEYRLQEEFLHDMPGNALPKETVNHLIQFVYALAKVDRYIRQRPINLQKEQIIIQNLAKKIWLVLEQTHQSNTHPSLMEESHRDSNSKKRQSSFDLISTCWALWEIAHDLRLVDEMYTSASSSPSLYSHLCQRLSKGDALGRLSTVQLVIAVKALSRRLSSTLFGTRYDSEKSPDCVFLRSVMKRLRKQTIREQLTPGLLAQALVAVLGTVEESSPNKGRSDLEGPDDDTHNKSSTENSMTNDQALFLFTLVKEQLSRFEHDSSTEKLTDNSVKNSVTFREAAVLFRSAKCVATKPSVRESDQWIRKRLQTMLLYNTNTSMASSSAESRLFSAATILETLAEWKDDTDIDRKCVDLIGNMLREDQLAAGQPTSSSTRQFNRILRSMAILGRNYTKISLDDENANSFYLLANQILSQDAVLQTSNFSFMANFLWFASVHGVSPATAQHLTHHVAQLSGTLDAHDSILQSEQYCSPRLACRILSSMTRLLLLLQSQQGVSEDESSDASAILQLRANLFETIEYFGEHLLSTQIEALDAANAMMVFAKASYVQDPGVFDHLATVLVTQLHECTTRQLVQGLWAIAKMVQLESGGLETEFDVTDDIPYLTYASHMAEHACQRASDMNAKDVAQIIWAFARLDYTARDLDMDGLIDQTRKVVPHMTAQEISNCLWGLSKIKPDAYGAIYLLTKQLQDESMCNALNFQEAVTVLYSLGRLDIRDEKVFETLSKKIFGIVNDDASNSASAAAAIANILWAHKKVHLTPPQEILDAWASKKLGLVPVTSMIKDDEQLNSQSEHPG